MDPTLKILDDILKRNSGDPDIARIDDEVWHYGFFDMIENPEDLETAWSLFDKSEEIRKRLAVIEGNVDTVPGWGYRIPQSNQQACSEEELKSLVSKHIANVRPYILEAEYNQGIINFIDNGFAIEIVGPDEPIPNASQNDLFGVLYETLVDSWMGYFSCEPPHYEVLYNWAIYLTKCDEVATYLLWPLLEHEPKLPESLIEPAVKLWLLDCRDRFWVKEQNLESKTIYVRPPWL